MRVLKAAVLYFAIVFGFGFVFGTIRTLYLVPRVGVRAAELMETPFMLLGIIVAARFVSRRLPDLSLLARFIVGGIALMLMLGAEFGFVRWLRGISLRQYMESRDPVSGTAYYLLLGLFAILPALLGRAKES